MDNKLSELSKPIGYFIEWQDEETGEKEWCECSKQNGAPLYSQEYVSALDKVAQYWIGESAGWKKRAEDAEKRIAELEAKLATPVRLQSPWVDKAGNRWLLEGTTADVIRASGFSVTVEGDE
ncbi:hypothetical protein SAMN02744783_00489 [Serratia sp. CC22-02]|uniref:hypothetical protein n=1 Tax=Serratia sp. CC22-02 TaxID=1378076 RepID=UPI002403874D|nr:hypothetical protein [Serratia sp. CC22-02]SMP41368.1 hypothetical protein SAMN02744783_00489 [Serratia sp. CC22-02]